MNETYTRQQAMERLGLKSANVFFQLERKYPQAFVIMKQGKSRDTNRYDKATIDKFAEMREYYIKEKYE